MKKQIFYIIAFIMAQSTISGVFKLGTLVYVIAVFAFFFLSFISGEKNLHFGSTLLIGFLIICVASIFINNPPSYFRVWERLLLFLNVLLAFSPLVISNRINYNRTIIFEGLVIIMMIFAVASFFGYFFGINFFYRNNELLDYTEAGHFSGFTTHSMVLAPVSAIGALYGLTKSLLKQSSEWKCLLWWSITIACFGSVFLSASRGALGGLVLGTVAVIYRYYAGRMGRVVQYVLVALAILSISFPLWGGVTDSVIKKNDYNISQGGVAYSREAKMAARLYEIENNFLTGVGFSVIDETVDSVDHITGTIEPNSSWLGVFSMTGVFGFLFFLFIFIHAIRTAYKYVSDNNNAMLLCGILAFFFVHMMIEGYVLAAGNILCGMYWLTIGTVYAYAPQRTMTNILFRNK